MGSSIDAVHIAVLSYNWAIQYITRLLIKSIPENVVLFFFSVVFFYLFFFLVYKIVSHA